MKNKGKRRKTCSYRSTGVKTNGVGSLESPATTTAGGHHRWGKIPCSPLPIHSQLPLPRPGPSQASPQARF